MDYLQMAEKCNIISMRINAFCYDWKISVGIKVGPRRGITDGVKKTIDGRIKFENYRKSVVLCELYPNLVQSEMENSIDE